jgi:hypothetical protein
VGTSAGQVFCGVMMTSDISLETRPSKPAISPSETGHGFQARFLGGALFVLLLLVLVSWVGFLGLMIWRVVSSLFG